MELRIRSVGIIAAMAATLTLASAVGDAASALTAAANAEMAKYAAAFKRKDAKACEKIVRANFAKDYKSYDMKGKMTGLDHMIQQDREHIAMLQKVNSCLLKMTDVKVNGTTATGKGSFSLDATVVGDPHKPKESHKLNVKAAWTSKMKKVGNKWWIVEDRTVSEKVLFDGKPMAGS